MKKFKVGDKVYFPLETRKVLTLHENKDTFDYPLLADGFSFTSDGRYKSCDSSASIFHATPENHVLLEQLYGVEFEKPPVKPTSKEIIQAMLERGWVGVACYVNDIDKRPSEYNKKVLIISIDEVGEHIFNDGTCGWKYATPFDPRTGEAITELPK